MIGRMRHPLDDQQIVYVSLVYEASDDWRPPRGVYYATEMEAFLATVKELEKRADAVDAALDELRVNLARMLDPAKVEDIIHIDRVLHRWDPKTGLLVPVEKAVPEGPEGKEEAAAVVMEEAMESLLGARERLQRRLGAEGVRRLIGMLRNLADAWETGETGEAGKSGSEGESA